MITDELEMKQCQQQVKSQERERTLVLIAEPLSFWTMIRTLCLRAGNVEGQTFANQTLIV